MKDDFIYSISWEDPRVDEEVLQIKHTDVVLTLSRAGDNSLDLLLQGAKEVHSVDMNPAQYYLLELKRLVIKYGSFNILWSMFGEGKMIDFQGVFESEIEPHTDDQGFINFWMRKKHYFEKGLYYYGCMGNIVSFLKFFRVGDYLIKDTLETQQITWEHNKALLRFIINVCCFFMSNFFNLMWYWCGCPKKQKDMIYEDERSLEDYIWDSVCPVFTRTHILENNYFYYLVLSGRFRKDNCPEYLKHENHVQLKMDIDNLHNTNNDLLDELRKRKYDKVILIDHMDWMDGEYIRELMATLSQQLNDNGIAIFRSASIYPWFIKTIRCYDDKLYVQSMYNHYPKRNLCFDRVNTYASSWMIQKKT